MTNTDLNAALTTALLEVLDETFVKVEGIYLDKATSIFETLATISATDASQVLSNSCATLAAHVAHMTYYNETLIQFINGEEPQTKWQHIWQTVEIVTVSEWSDIQQALRNSYERVRTTVSDMIWQNSDQIGEALGILAHNAYHLGEIRQMSCQLR